MIIIYRIEDHKGNGPWINRDGSPGYLSIPTMPNQLDGLLSGCISINELIDYFKQRVDLNDLFNHGYKIVGYMVKDIEHTRNHILFDPYTAIRLGDI